MKKIIWTTFLLLSIQIAEAQQGIAEVGRVAAGFDYEDSEGNNLENVHPVHNFSYSLGYRRELSPVFYAVGSLIYNRYGVMSSDPIYDNKFEWDVEYLGLSLGVDAEVLRKNRLVLLALIAAEPQFMLRGTQTISNQVYDLKGEEQFERPFFFLRGGVGVNYCLDNKIAVFGRYRYGMGFPLGESDDPERLWLTSSTLSIGLMVSFGHYNYCQKKHFK